MTESGQQGKAWNTALTWTYHHAASPIFRAIGLILYYLAIALLFLFKLLYRPVAFLLQPVILIGRFVVAGTIIAPFLLLAKLETLYIYLGVAAVVGLLVGLAISFLCGSLQAVLRLNDDHAPANRTAKDYREAKRKHKARAEAPLMSSGVPLSPNGVAAGYLSLSDGTRQVRRGRGLLSQTIIEEVDSDY